MSAASERRQDSDRIALQGLVDVSHGERPFAARAVDLSRGGMSMRATCLPSVGQVLECRFACGRAGPWVAATVEVAWARMKDERSGEFGVSFVDVDDRARLLIEELVAEQTALQAAAAEPEPVEQAPARPSHDRVGERQQALDYGAEPEAQEPKQGVSAQEAAAQAVMDYRGHARQEVAHQIARDEAVANEAAEDEVVEDEVVEDEVVEDEVVEDDIVEDAAIEDEVPMRSESVSVPIAELVIDGVSAPVEAEAIDAHDDRVTYAQPLGPWRIGGAVQAPTGDGDARQGNVERVELKLVGNVPMLAVTVDFAGASRAYGEFEFGNTVQGVAQGRVHDTEPDTDAPDLDEEPNRFSLITAHEFPAPSVDERYAAQPPDVAVVADAAHVEARAREEESVLAQAAEDVVPEQVLSTAGGSRSPAYDPAPTPPVLKAPELDEMVSEQARRSEAGDGRETAGVHDTQSVALHDPELDAMLPTSPLDRARTLGRQVRVRWLRLVAASRELMAGRWTNASGWLTRVARTVVPALRSVAVRARSIGRGTWGRLLGTRLGAARRLLVGLRRRRRTTTAPSQEQRARRRLGVGIGWVFVGLIAIALAAYALLPMEMVAGPLLHRSIEPDATEGVATAGAALEDEQASREAWARAGEEIAAEEAQPAATAPQAAPAAKPMAAKPQAKQPAPKQAAPPKPAATQAKAPKARVANGTAFGDANVEQAERYVLRMSQPVRELRGVADGDGFSVVIPGSLALDRAGPISAKHSAVRRSMILNRGDRSELTIRFERGKKPSYQVRADGASLVILLGS
jgi:hypothetical protein